MPAFEHRRWAYRLPDMFTCSSGRSYTLLEQLGAGANGVVFSCEEDTTGEVYAVKVQLNTRSVRLSRFAREVRILRDLSHEHIVKFIDSGTVQGKGNPARGRSFDRAFPFVVMRRATQSLASLMDSRATGLAFDEYFAQFAGLADALVRLHEQATHRDIKPGNILVSGEVWQLSDFGLCGLNEAEEDLTHQNEAVGPRYWMSPAAVGKAMGLGDDIGPHSDVFQLAAVFWFVATRRPPIGVLTEADWSGGPAPLGRLLIRALQHAPARRPRTAKEFLKEIESLRT